MDQANKIGVDIPAPRPAHAEAVPGEPASALAGTAEDPGRTPEERLADLWPAIREDAAALQDVANPLTPTRRLMELWQANILAAPALHIGTVAQEVLARLPPVTTHLLVIPWLGISGGSEKVTQRLVRYLRERYEHGQLAILAPDAVFDLGPVHRLFYDVPIVALNDLDRRLSAMDRAEIVDLVLTQLRPRTVHIINSEAGWDALRQHARDHVRASRIFVNIYSDIRLLDAAPAGYFWRYLPELVDHVTGVLADNAAVVARAAENFSLTPEQRSRFHVVPTPMLGMKDDPHAVPMRRFARGAGQSTLWMSRIAHEKRLDVVRAVAERLPGRQFSIYGAILPGSVPADFLDWTLDTANVRYRGGFDALESLPLDAFDSYLFTTSAEGMPLSVLEAALLGLPTVAPAVGGIGEFIDETTGWLIPRPDASDLFAAALEEIAAHPDEAARRVAAAQRRLAERHSWASFARALSGIPGYIVPGGARA
jgi:glycosyltransferase involved in cell wall biosynthesis